MHAAIYITLNNTSKGAIAELRGGFSLQWSISPSELRLWITACCVFNHPNHKPPKNTNLAGYPAIFELQDSSSVPWQRCRFRDHYAFSLKICQRLLRCKGAQGYDPLKYKHIHICKLLLTCKLMVDEISKVWVIPPPKQPKFPPPLPLTTAPNA